MSRVIRTEGDIERIERDGIDAFFQHRTPYAIIRASAKAAPNRIALRYVRDADDPSKDEVISYAELLKRVRQAANLFRRLGIGREDSVAILTPNIPQGQIALWAAGIAGRACPVNPFLRPDHLGSLMKAANVKVAVVLGMNSELQIWPDVIGTLREAGIKTVLETDSDSPSPGSDGSFEALFAAEPGDQLTFGPEPSPDDVAAYFHTGGTTGTPKLAQHLHGNQAFVGLGASLMYDLTPEDVMVNGFPIFHVAGSFVFGLSCLSAQAEAIMPGRLGMRNRAFLASIWKQFERHKVTVFANIPTVMSGLNGKLVDADISSLRLILTGGTPLPTELADSFERQTGKPIRNILGMTECAGVVSIEPYHGTRVAGSTGLRLPFTRVEAFKIKDGTADLSSPCARGETGIIALSGPNVSPGYTETKLNSGTFEPGGWLVSGDLGHIDAHGKIFVTGRAKDVIIRGGHNLDPTQIEEVLVKHPAVANAAAVGQPDSYAGELPVAFVTLREGAQATPEEILEFVGPLVAESAAKPKQVWILGDMPVTPVGKIYKPALRVIATRSAIEAAIEKAEVAKGDVEIDITEKQTVLRLAKSSAADAGDRIRKALMGMPLKYEVVEANK